jgi:7-cyano-7-deazaguanine synthase
MATEPGTRAVVLLSGGLDSATTLAAARRDGFACWCLSVDYGQRHIAELRAAESIARALGAQEHRVVSVDLRAIGGSALTADIDVPGADQKPPGIPVTYVPARNMTMLAIAAGYAEVLDARRIFIGVNAIDFSGYPDCRPDFIAAMEHAMLLGTRAGAHGAPLRIHAPLIDMSKAQIISLAVSLGVDLAMTTSCYNPDGTGAACGRCESCTLRSRGFAEAGIPDPTRYAAEPAR